MLKKFRWTETFKLVFVTSCLLTRHPWAKFFRYRTNPRSLCLVPFILLTRIRRGEHPARGKARPLMASSRNSILARERIPPGRSHPIQRTGCHIVALRPCYRQPRLPVACQAQKDDDEADNSSNSFIEGVKDFFDFANWAPRSSQAWRLGGLDSQSSISNSMDSDDADSTSGSKDAFSDDSFGVLNERVAEQRRSMSGSILDMDGEIDADQDGQQPSFLKSTDEEFASSLNSRMTEVANSTPETALDAEEYVGLDGETLLNLIEAKFGKKHDVSFVRRDIPGKTLVSLNVYHAYLGQKSFPMTEEDFKEKMDGVALALNLWDQAETVVAFLKAPVRSSRGLPSRPIVGNAVSISLELTRDQIMEWWGR